MLSFIAELNMQITDCEKVTDRTQDIRRKACQLIKSITTLMQ